MTFLALVGPTHGRRPVRPSILPAVAAWLLLPSLLWACAPVPPPTAAAADAPVVSGSVETLDGVRVLRLWGRPEERGYAHGYLLAEDILAMVAEGLLHPAIFPEIEAYESGVRDRMIHLMNFPRDRRRELEGLLAGVTARLGAEKMQLPRVNRALMLDDLVALNTFADWAGMMCSTFSAWDDLVEGGETLTARNLDYTPLPALRERQLLIARVDPSGGRRRWVTVGWPGVIGAYTAMNEAGVTVSMHDVNQEKPAGKGPFTPRSCVLAEIMEAASEGDALVTARDVMKAHPVACGNNIHVSMPSDGGPKAAAVFEYDSDRERSDGVTERGPGDGDALALPDAVACTNHYRARTAAAKCSRMERIATAVRQAAESGQRLDAAAARRIIAHAANETTLHTVVFRPNAKMFDVSFAAGAESASDSRVHTFRLEDLLRKP